MIHKLTDIHSDAKIGKNVTIEAFTSISPNVVIGDNTWIGSNVTIMDGARIGKNCKIFPGSVISAIPQDLKFKGEETTLELGDNNTIRECVTLNRGTASRGKTVIGDNNLFMAYSHVGHDCVIQNKCIIGNAVQIAGEVEVDDWVIVSGGTPIHQFSKLGKHAMVGGASAVLKDIPPYTLSGSNPITYMGINVVGLKRRNFSKEAIDIIHDCYRLIYQSNLNISQAIEAIEKEVTKSEEKDTILKFIKNSDRGIIKRIGKK